MSVVFGRPRKSIAIWGYLGVLLGVLFLYLFRSTPKMLTDQKVKALKPKEKQYKVSDEKGLYLLVKPNAGKYWRLKYRLSGKEKNLAIGVYPDVSLKKARLARDDAKKLVQSGIDPVQDKQEQKLKRLELSNNSFEVVAREWVEKCVINGVKDILIGS